MGLVVHEVLFEHLGDEYAEVLDVGSLGFQKFFVVLVIRMRF